MKRLASALVSVLSGCGDYPRDIDGTLDRMRGGVVRVEVVAGSADPREAALERSLGERFPGARVGLRQTGPYIRAELVGADDPEVFPAELWPAGRDGAWRWWEVPFRKEGSAGDASTPLPSP